MLQGIVCRAWAFGTASCEQAGEAAGSPTPRGLLKGVPGTVAWDRVPECQPAHAEQRKGAFPASLPLLYRFNLTHVV